MLARIILGAAATVMAAGGRLVRRGWPRHRGSLRLPGLTAPVEIRRDRHGVPHVYAAGTDDLFFAQGFVHAQDRLFQMDLQRRTGLGQLAELLGPRALPVDRLHRRIGLHRAAARDLEHLDDGARAALDAYTAGVNAFLAQGRRPLEHMLLRARPRPWHPVDSLAWAKVMQWELSDDSYRTLARERLTKAVGPARAADLLPGGPVTEPLPTSPSALQPAWPSAGHVVPQLPGPGAADGLGSNAWAVSGDRTLSGAPMLANDMHLPLAMPGVAYEIALHAPGYECAGISLPGNLGVLAGHNAHVAWGIAITRARTQDLYVEHVDPGDPTRYLVGNDYQRFELMTERIAVRGRPDDVLTARTTRHGPVISDDERIGEPDRVLSLRAAQLMEPSAGVRALLDLGAARDWPSFRAALRSWDAPTATFVYADVHGVIAARTAGRIPLRARGAVTTPVPGWDDSAEWVGTIPFDELPEVVNPETGIVVAANANPVADEYPHFLASEWCTDSRERRIRELMDAVPQLTPDLLHAAQLDTCSPVARRLAPFLAAAPAEHGAARELLRRWDHRMTPDSPAAGLYVVAVHELVTDLVRPVLDAELTTFYLTREHQYTAFLDRVIDQPASPWWGAGPRARDRRLAAAVDAAARWWTERAGPDPASWRWGREHDAEFRHPVLHGVPVIRRLADTRVGPVAGDAQCVFATAAVGSLRTVSGPAHRHVVDLVDWDTHRQAVQVGQSGHPGHPHYRDQLANWRDGGLHPVPWSRPAVEKVATAVLHLLPSES